MPNSSDLEKFHFPELCNKIFGKEGYASILPNFEYRPEQKEMAYCCAQALSSDMPILFEAGTGIGKSLAYLIPGIIASVRFRRQLVVATHTIALQQQIIEKDLPRIQMLFSNCVALEDCADFKCALLLGRSNYLCTNRLKRAISEKKELFDSEESKELDRIAQWALTTTTGLVDELSPPPNPEVWNWVNANSSSCSQKNCSDGTCFYQNARKQVASADIIILNHSLLFALLSAGLGTENDSKGVLFANDMLVLDEAHLVPSVASDAFGSSLSNTGILRELKRIYDPKKHRGLISRDGMAEHYDKQIVLDTISACEDFFANIKKEFLITRDSVRLTVPNWIDTQFVKRLDILASLLDAFAMNAKTDKLASELRDYKRSIVGFKNTIEDCIFLSDTENNVYWVERTGKDGKGATLNLAPLKVAGILRREIFSKESPVILTSATLAINGDMSTFISKIGADDAESFVEDSPFDFNKNMRAFIATDSPTIEKSTGKLDNTYLSKMCLQLSQSVRGGTLILFTNYFDLNKTASYLQDNLEDRQIFVQGRLSRSQTVKEFIKSGNGVLLGTDTFWTGIDIPGENLCQVIITRLPFENFNHPLLQARLDRVKAEGGNPFAEISLPTAIIKFRQGVGRLIRSANDKGIVVILDSRIATKSYGKNFVRAIQTNRVERFCQKDISTLILDTTKELSIENLTNNKNNSII